MNLINGRGQLGSALSSKELYINNLDVYHTWNFLDKSSLVQKREYYKFINYLADVPASRKVIFISTTSQNDTSYVYYKRRAEQEILQKTQNSLVIRFPCIIGRGVFSEFINQTIEPYGIVDFLTIDECCDFLMESLDCTGIVEPKSWKISAKALVELVDYVKNGQDNLK